VDGKASTEPGVTTASPWVFVVVFAAAGAASLWHARNITAADDDSGKKAWPWMVTGLALLGVAGVVAASTGRASDNLTDQHHRS
jgi:hypothetical protein